MSGNLKRRQTIDSTLIPTAEMTKMKSERYKGLNLVLYTVSFHFGHFCCWDQCAVYILYSKISTDSGLLKIRHSHRFVAVVMVKVKVKVKSAYGPQSANQAGALLRFLWHEATRSISTPPWMGRRSIAGLPPSIKFAGTHLYTWLLWLYSFLIP